MQCAAGLTVREKWRSKTHAGGGKEPNWNDKHSFNVVEGDDRLNVQVYDEDSGKDDLIGSVSIDLNTLFQRGTRDEFFPLTTSTGKNAGEIRVVLQFQPQGSAASSGAPISNPYNTPAATAPSPGAPPAGYGAPPANYGAPPTGAPPPGYGAPPPGYGAPPPGYGAPPPGYGAAPPGYNIMQQAPPPGYGAPYGVVRPGVYGGQMQMGMAAGYPPIPGAIGVMKHGKFKHGKLKQKGGLLSIEFFWCPTNLTRVSQVSKRPNLRREK